MFEDGWLSPYLFTVSCCVFYFLHMARTQVGGYEVAICIGLIHLFIEGYRVAQTISREIFNSPIVIHQVHI